MEYGGECFDYPGEESPELIIERLGVGIHEPDEDTSDYQPPPLPEYAREGDAGFDLRYWIRDYILRLTDDLMPGETSIYTTGLRCHIPDGYELQIRSRSSTTFRGLVVANSPGTIDSGYRGEIKVLLHNNSKKPIRVSHGDKIAQAVLVPVTQANIVEGVVSTDTERGEAGFGSTGR